MYVCEFPSDQWCTKSVCHGTVAKKVVFSSAMGAWPATGAQCATLTRVSVKPELQIEFDDAAKQVKFLSYWNDSRTSCSFR